MIKDLFKKQVHPQRLGGLDYTFLAAGLGLFVLLSLVTITKSSVWFDEAFSAYLIRFDFWQIASYTAVDVHPPLYYWVLKAWSLVFGTGEFALRAMSVFFGAVAIFFGYRIARDWFGRNVAVLGLLFMALSPMLIRYSQEMRMYTLAAAIVMAATFVLLRASRGDGYKNWVLYGVLVALGMLTHYFTALVWIAHWVWRLWDIWQEKKRLSERIKAFFSKKWIVAHLVAVVLFLPWIPALFYQVIVVQSGGFWIPPVGPMTLPNFLTNTLYYQDQNGVESWLALLFVALFILLIVFTTKAYRSLEKSKRSAFMLVGAVAIVPPLVLFLASMPPLQPSFVERYLVPSALALTLFSALVVVLAKFKKPAGLAKAVSGALFVVALLYGVSSVYSLGNFNKNLQTANLTREVMSMAEAKDPQVPIVTDTPWLFYEAVYYERQDRKVYFLDESTRYEFGALAMLRDNDYGKIKDLAMFARSHEKVWYISKSGTDTIEPPRAEWQVLRSFTVSDPVAQKPLYVATEYKIN